MQSHQIIQTKFLAGQGLGNQLWVYAAGHALAKKLGRQHVVLGMDVFKGASFLDIDVGVDPDPDMPINQFNEILYYDPSLKYFSSTYDCRVESLPLRVQINGLFQSERYLNGNSKKIASWIRPSEYIKKIASNYKDICILNLRGGEYKRHSSFILPRSYWDMAIKILKQDFQHEEIIVVTDDPPYARTFLPEFPVLEGGIAECYAALMGAKAVVASNSSFSYFPIKTRDDKPFIIAPKHWGRYGHPVGRWAMPANVYEDWNYLGSDGCLVDYTRCLEEAEIDAKYYEECFNVRVPSNMQIGFSWASIIPATLKRPIKKLASTLFPGLF